MFTCTILHYIELHYITLHCATDLKKKLCRLEGREGKTCGSICYRRAGRTEWYGMVWWEDFMYMGMGKKEIERWRGLGLEGYS